MYRALLKLFLMRLRGGVRRRLPGLITLRGAAFLAFGLYVFALGLGPSLGMSDAVEETFQEIGWSTVGQPVQQLMPVALLGACLLTILTTSQPSIYFSPAEINFLFCGPFTRRSLLLYKIGSYAVGTLFSATLIAIAFPHYAGGRFAAFLGGFLTLFFIQLFGLAVGLTGQAVARNIYARVKWMLLAILTAALLLGFWQVRQYASEGGLLAGLNELRQSTVGVLVLMPFEPFSRTFTADNYGELARWGLLAAAIDAGLASLVVRLDTNYFESASASSQRMYRRWLRASRGGSVVASAVTAHWRLPQPYRLSGVGSIAWRQMTTAVRTSARALFVIFVIGIIAGAAFAILLREGMSIVTVIALIVSASLFIFPKVITFDFRGDYEHMELLKSLPINSLAISVGQLILPILASSIAHLSMLTGALFCVPPSYRWVLFTIALFVVPINLLLCGLDNLAFLLFPARLLPVGRVDFEFFGRLLMETTAKTIVLLFTLIGAFGIAAMSYAAHDRSVVLFIFVSLSITTLAAMLIVPCISWAYQRFDVSRDVIS